MTDIPNKTISGEGGKLWALREREIPPDERRKWTARIAAEPEPENRDQASALVFRIGAEWLALPTSAFLEVAPISAIHSLPHKAEGAVLGIANVRGELLTCVSINVLLRIGGAVAASEISGRFLVVEHASHRFVIQVDEVDAVHRYNSATLIPVPATLEASVPHFTLGLLRIGNRTVGCLDSTVLLSAIQRIFA